MRVCMVAYSFYESDNRIRRYAETLARRGDIVDVIALKRRDRASRNTLNGVNIYKVQEREGKERGNFTYLYRLLMFLLKSTLFISRKHLKNPYDLIHVHSVPDFEVFCAWLPKLTGAKIILDIHDIVPEFYNSKFGTDKNSLIFKCLVLIEKLSIGFSDHIIISNHIWEKTIISRSSPKKKCTTIINYPDNNIFSQRDVARNKDKFIMMYPGTVNWHQGLDIAVKAFAIVKAQAKHAEFHIYGGGPEMDNLQALIKQLGLEQSVLFKGSTSLDKIAKIMASADLGIVPKRNDPFGGEAFSTKTLEFMSLKVPIIVSRTKIDQYYFNDSLVKFFEPGDEKDLADAMLFLINSEQEREKLVQSALKFVEENNWDSKKQLYTDIVHSLIS